MDKRIRHRTFFKLEIVLDILSFSLSLFSLDLNRIFFGVDNNQKRQRGYTHANKLKHARAEGRTSRCSRALELLSHALIGTRTPNIHAHKKRARITSGSYHVLDD